MTPLLAVLAVLAFLAEPALPRDGATRNSSGCESFFRGRGGGGEGTAQEVSPDAREGSHHVSRRRRYLNFPEGSTVNVVVCLTISPFMPQNWYTFGMTAGMGFALPNASFFSNPENLPLILRNRRDRRQLYNRLEEVLHGQGLNGRSCMLRLICEAAAIPEKPKGTFLQELVRIVFTSHTPPSDYESTSSEESLDHASYDEANQRGKRARELGEGGGKRGKRKKKGEAEQCADYYSQCPHSLLGAALVNFASTSEDADHPSPGK